MSPLASYRQLFRLAGPAYVVVAFLGRLPLAMSQLGALLLVAGSTGSYGAGGATAGALAMANAVGAPWFGGLSDRLGQRRVVVAQSWAGAAGLLTVVALSAAGVPWGWQAVAAGCSGFVLPQVGPLARVRWRPITREWGEPDDRRRLVDAAFSYEGAADEASFVLGPALVGALAALVSPAAALVVAAVVLAAFGSLFALHPTAALLTRTSRRARKAGASVLTVAMVALAGSQLLVGVVFGSVQTGTTVLARDAGMLGATGLLQALLGVGSVIAGLAAAGLPERFGYETRLVVFTAALLVLATPLLWVDSLGSLAVVLTLLGFAVAPTMITVFTLAERLAPPARVGGVMTMLAGVTGLGYAIGSSVAGRLADDSGHTAAYDSGHTAAYAVTVTATVLGLVLAASAAPHLRRRGQAGRAADAAGQAMPQARSASTA